MQFFLYDFVLFSKYRYKRLIQLELKDQNLTQHLPLTLHCPMVPSLAEASLSHSFYSLLHLLVLYGHSTSLVAVSCHLEYQLYNIFDYLCPSFYFKQQQKLNVFTPQDELWIMWAVFHCWLCLKMYRLHCWQVIF